MTHVFAWLPQTLCLHGSLLEMLSTNYILTRTLGLYQALGPKTHPWSLYYWIGDQHLIIETSPVISFSTPAGIKCEARSYHSVLLIHLVLMRQAVFST
jgi:hypothetical protein